MNLRRRLSFITVSWATYQNNYKDNGSIQNEDGSDLRNGWLKSCEEVAILERTLCSLAPKYPENFNTF